MSSPSVPTKYKSLSGMKRTALDASGYLGSLYDGNRDLVLEKLDDMSQESAIRLDENVPCHLANTDQVQSQNILKLIGFDEDLRLSLILNLEPRTGLASLIDHPTPINEYTRILHYTYVNREERIPDNGKQMIERIKLSISQTNATHMITNVRWGIHFVVVLQLPCDPEMVTSIDAVLKKTQAFLNNDLKAKELASDDLNQLEKITDTKIYSNIPALAKLITVNEICQHTNLLKNNCPEHCQIEYTLCPIELIYAQYNEPYDTFIHIPSTIKNTIEQHFLELRIKMRNVLALLQHDLSKLASKYFKERFHDDQWVELKKKYTDEVEEMFKLVIACRRGQVETSQITEAISGERQKTLAKDIYDLANTLHELKTKGEWIKELQQQSPFQYWNVAEQNVGNLDNEQTIEQTLLKDHQQQRILCSTDSLRSNNSSKWNKLRDQLIEEHQANPNLHLIYADFSYCSFQLSDIITLPLCKMTKTEDANKQDTSSPSTEPKPSGTPPTSSTNETFNILLLGESGVGKSTFINAFANYLTFETFQEAEEGKPVVLMPVSFMMTAGDNFEERTVKFGDVDSLNNEDFNHPGQSVTQHCKSYVFHLNHRDGRKLRIIDTPGFGDTRGLDQDDLNMQYILEYINNFTHLNAVCFLLKPNVARLNIFFRTCLTELLNFLGPNIRNNIIFCFTNARSTFYTPGDTGPLLRTMLNSLPKTDIPFKKENTFCFDSESFRYLVALQDGIKFEDEDKHEYKKSWSTSVIESNRLIDYIHSDLTEYYIHDAWKSVKHAQVEIVHMIRPMLEAMRNILRNILLFEMDPNKRSIDLCPKLVDRPLTMCLLRKRDLIERAGFWILSDSSLKCLDTDLTRRCTPDQHILIEYTLDYNIVHSPSKDQKNELSNQLSLLHDSSAVFAHFLMHIALCTKDDPFLTGLRRMIQEEQIICSEQTRNHLNKRLSEELEKLWFQVGLRSDEVKSNKEHTELTTVYELIKIVHNSPEVCAQMAAVKSGQGYMIQQYEYEVPNN